MTNNRSVIKLMRLYNELLAHSGPDEIKKSTFRCTTAAEYRFPTTRIASCLQLLLRALSQDVNSNLWCVLLVFWLRRRNKKSQGNEGIMQHPPSPPTLSTPASFEDIRGKRIWVHYSLKFRALHQHIVYCRHVMGKKLQKKKEVKTMGRKDQTQFGLRNLIAVAPAPAR